MLVKLPREVTGKELIEAVQKAAKVLNVDDYLVESDTEERYEPGSVKRSIDNTQISIRKLTEVTKREGFLWLKQRKVKVPALPELIFPKLFSDNKYKEVDIQAIRKIFGGGSLIPIIVVGYNNKTFDEIRPVFEKLVAGIYKELTTIETN